MSVISSILSPAFLAHRIELIALLIGAAVLVLFEEKVLKHLVFPVADLIKETTHSKLINYRPSEGFRVFAKYFSEALATIIFLVYCYVGASLLAEYFFEPLLMKMKPFILIPVVLLFLILSYAINNLNMRRTFFNSE